VDFILILYELLILILIQNKNTVIAYDKKRIDTVDFTSKYFEVKKKSLDFMISDLDHWNIAVSWH